MAKKDGVKELVSDLRKKKILKKTLVSVGSSVKKLGLSRKESEETRARQVAEASLRDALTKESIVHGKVYAHISNSGTVFEIRDEGYGPTIVIRSSAFGNQIDEKKIFTDPATLKHLATLFSHAAKQRYSKEYCCPARADSIEIRDNGECLEKLAKKFKVDLNYKESSDSSTSVKTKSQSSSVRMKKSRD